MAGLKQPDSFLDKPGPITVPWKTWVAQFENYLVASGGTNYPVARKKALLLHCLGKEAQRVFQNLPDHDNPPAGASEYDKALLVLEKHFGPKINVVAERYKFRQRAQRPGETAQDYVAALRELAVTCNFGAMRDEMIRDQLVKKTTSDKIREKLFMEENLTLARAIQVATRIEEAMEGAKAVTASASPTPTSDDNNVSAVQKNKYKKYKPANTSSMKGATDSTKPKRYCYRCGSSAHKANYENCPALGKTCNACNRDNHFFKVCTQRLINEVCNSDSCCNSDRESEVQILATESSVNERKRVECNVQVNKVILSMYVDSLADRSILDLVTFQQYFVDEAIEPPGPEDVLSSYTKDRLPVVGTYNAEVRFKSRTAVVKFVIVKCGRCLLGLDAIKDLDLCIAVRTLTVSELETDSEFQTNRGTNPEYQLPESVPFPEGPWEKLGLVIVGPFVKAPLNTKFAISLIDYHSKWPEVGFVEKVTSQSVITFLTSVFSREGFPLEIVTDHGPQFISKEFEGFLEERKITHCLSSVYYPQANGAVERWNSVLKNAVQNAVVKKESIKENVLQLIACYRATPHATTGEKPCKLLHGRDMRTKLDIAGFQKKQKEVDLEKVRDKVKHKQNMYKQNADKRRNVKEPVLEPGDFVKLRKPQAVGKGDPQYTPPIKIIQVVRPGTYMLADGKIFNQSKLSPVKVDQEQIEVQEKETPVAKSTTAAQNNSENPVIRKGARVRKPSVWLKDYK